MDTEKLSNSFYSTEYFSIVTFDNPAMNHMDHTPIAEIAQLKIQIADFNHPRDDRFIFTSIMLASNDCYL